MAGFLVLLFGCVCGFLGIAWTRYVDRKKRQRRAATAKYGEERAIELLEYEGFTVLECQPTQDWTVYVDGQARSFELRADLLVEQDDNFYVVEVKTGDLATNINWAATRRQLLEYRLAYPVQGVLLVDAESETLHQIEFDFEGDEFSLSDGLEDIQIEHLLAA